MWLFEYETPKVIKVQSIPLGILRVLLKILVVVFVIAYELWHCRGYQKFTSGAKCLVFVSSCSVKTRELSYAQYVYFLRKVCLFFNL